MRVTPVIDRDYFKSVYFRQPQGIFFESPRPRWASPSTRTLGSLGEEPRLPTPHEHLRLPLERLQDALTNRRATRRAAARSGSST